MTGDIRFLVLALLLAACGDDSAVVPGSDAGSGRDSGTRDAAVRDAGPASSFDAGAEPIDAAMADSGDVPTDAGGEPMPDAGSMCPDPADPHVMYVARTPEECALVDFICAAPFYTPFSNECGCGCLFECPAEGTPGITYFSRDALECMIITVVCPERETMFRNECGCGCISGGGRP